MKAYTVVLLLTAFVFVECSHTFMGTSVLRALVYHKEARFPSRIFQKRIEFLNFTLPAVAGYSRSIQIIPGESLSYHVQDEFYELWHNPDYMELAAKYQQPCGSIFKGILAIDMTHSGASANVTAGGLGFNFVNLRMKSDRAKELNYDVYIYA